MNPIPPVSPGSLHRAVQRSAISPFGIARAQVAGLLHPTQANPPRCQPLGAATPSGGTRIVPRWPRSATADRQRLVFVEKGHNLGRQIHAAYQGERSSTTPRQALAAGEATIVDAAARRYPALQGMARRGQEMLAAHRRRLEAGTSGFGNRGPSLNELDPRLPTDRLAR